jgi:hypothetical protein
MLALCDRRGIASFAEAGTRGREAGQIIAARGSVRFAGQRPVRQRSLSAEAFLVTFVATKVTGHGAAKSATHPNLIIISMSFKFRFNYI